LEHREHGEELVLMHAVTYGVDWVSLTSKGDAKSPHSKCLGRATPEGYEFSAYGDAASDLDSDDRFEGL
jgi:hypothetical protein